MQRRERTDGARTGKGPATAAARRDISHETAPREAIATRRTIPRASATVAMKLAILPESALVFHLRLRQRQMK